jgi:1-acyl-sn-glycerol-3-phosphate acyltransferase
VGVPKLTAADGGLLVVSNHQSFLDPMVLATAVPRPLSFLARKSLFDVPGLGKLIAALGAFPVRRGVADSRALRQILRVLHEGKALLMFPEGTRTRDGSLGVFKPGAAAIAIKCNVPVLPVCVEGAFECWPRQSALPRAARMAVGYGLILDPQGMTAEALTDQMRAEVARAQSRVRARLAEVS